MPTHVHVTYNFKGGYGNLSKASGPVYTDIVLTFYKKKKKRKGEASSMFTIRHEEKKRKKKKFVVF